MKNILTIILLAFAATVSAQQTIRLTGEKSGQDTQVDVTNVNVHEMFDMISGGGLDVTCLGAAPEDPHRQRQKAEHRV